MAKRRRLVAPDSSELDKIEEGFAAKPQVNPFAGAQTTVPPIAKVAAETAQAHGMANVTDRVEAAKDKADAEKWRKAEGQGRAVQMVPVAAVDRDYLRRDRMGLDAEEMAELISSIETNGLRSPIEVVPQGDGFGLVSGYRRLEAFVRLGIEEIPAFVRIGQEGADAYVSMIEENELRADLSPYERGRIAVLVAGQGVFGSVEEAVDALFAAASRAKRSKVRSFAAVHEALGDMLSFPSFISERLGLKLATALRNGGQVALRSALAVKVPATANEEINFLESALRALEDAEPEKDLARGGRPKEVVKFDGGKIARGGRISAELGAKGLRIDLKGCDLEADETEALLQLIREHLG